MKTCCDCGEALSSNTPIRCSRCSHKKNGEKLSELKKDDGNPMWRGDSAKKEAIHIWVKNRKPKPELCEKCHLRPPNDLANISGEYRRDVEDYQWLCRKCHMDSDGRYNNLRQYSTRDGHVVQCRNCGHWRFFTGRGKIMRCFMCNKTMPVDRCNKVAVSNSDSSAVVARLNEQVRCGKRAKLLSVNKVAVSISDSSLVVARLNELKR